MKYMKKLSALLLALVMVFSMTVGASAAEPYSITIKNTTDGHTYEAYQIFVGDLSDAANPDNDPTGTAAVLANIKWGASVDNAEDLNTAAAVAEKLAKCEMTVDDLLKMVTLKATAYKTSEDKGDTYVISGLEAGYYLVKDKDDTLDDKYDAYTDFVLEVVENSVVFPKASVPEVDKKIVEGTDKVTVNEAGVGETVNYEITGTLPSNIGEYKEYYYKFTDTLSKGLDYNNDMKVTVNDVDVTKYFYKNATTYDETNGTTITVAIQDLLALENLKDAEGNAVVGTITKDTKIVLTYSATVNENAVINGANPNKVDLEYSNNPNDSGDGTPDTPPENPDDEPTTTEPTGKTPQKEVETYVTEVHINKVDGAGKALTGATFQITGESLKTVLVTTYEYTADENGTYWKLTDGTYTTQDPNGTIDGVAVDQTKYEKTTQKYSMAKKTEPKTVTETLKVSGAVGADGKLTFTGLGAGTYIIKEIVTPAGYNTVADITLEVTFNAGTKTFSYEWSGGADGSTNSIDVINQAGSTLPETGGMGTTLFYIVGGILVLAAVVLLVTKKRMSSAE